VIGESSAFCGQKILYSFLSLQRAMSKILIVGEDKDNIGFGLGGNDASAKTQND
jgi:hypothetical protein